MFVYIGGSLEKQRLSAPFTPESFFGGQTTLRTGEPPAYPQWYVDLGYPAADTDGDGIPDYWERRTHTNPAVASTATLSPAHGATGLRRAALRAEWDGRRGLDIERNRLEVVNGAMVDIENVPAKDDFLRLKLTAHGAFRRAGTSLGAAQCPGWRARL